MDLSLAELITKSGTDAFAQMQFANGEPLKSKVRSIKSTSRSSIAPIFNYELWYPISCPSMTQAIKFSMWDHDPLASELIGCNYAKLNLISGLPGEKTGAFWANLYGAPEDGGITLKNAVAAAANELKNVGGTNYKEKYNNFPDLAPSYKGRVLIQHRIEMPENRSLFIQ
jgi:hypothetical protein